MLIPMARQGKQDASFHYEKSFVTVRHQGGTWEVWPTILPAAVGLWPPLVMALVGQGVAVGTPVGTQTSIWICWKTDKEGFCVASNSTGVCSQPVTIILK